jgi:NTE family protein
VDTGASPPLRTDLVLEGGGVKGLGLVGAVAVLDEAGYAFPRVAGTSAGAIVGALVAALQRAGEPVSRLQELARTLDYSRVSDSGPVGRALGPLGFLADGASLLLEGGLYEGQYLRTWLGGVLGDLGVRTFGDLRLSGELAGDLPPERAYALVVTASDVSRRRLVRFPWEAGEFGLDPDEQSVVAAVAASAAIPFFFEPVHLPLPRGSRATLVDGGLLSNFPVGIFDRALEAGPPRWPTFGVRLSSREDAQTRTRQVGGLLSLALATVETMIEACDARHIDEPCVVARTVFVDTSGVSAVDFGIDAATQARLLDAGRAAAGKFLAGWDWPTYLSQCRSMAGVVA